MFRIASCILRRSNNCSGGLELLKIDTPSQLYQPIRLAGHAKWQNIKNTKEANDLNKGKITSRFVQMVKKSILSENMQTDPKLNKKLADVLLQAAKANVPKATLERAITRAANMKVINCNVEIQGPGGCAIIARCETENVGSLRRDVKKTVKKFDSLLLVDDSYINLFMSKGFIRTKDKLKDNRDVTPDFAEDSAIHINAEEVFQEAPDGDCDESSTVYVFTTDAQGLNVCKGELEKLGFKILSTTLELVPYRVLEFDQTAYAKVEECCKALREMDQVVEVYHNVMQPSQS